MQVSGRNYLVPVDAKLTTASALDFEVVPLDLVHRTMEREARTNILFFDACRDNPLLETSPDPWAPDPPRSAAALPLSKAAWGR